jgi:hypothetical protein
MVGVAKLIERYGRRGNLMVKGEMLTATVPSGTSDCTTAAT